MAVPPLEGRTAVITGASRGIGAALAAAWAAHGVRLGLCSRSAPALPDGPNVVAARLDVTASRLPALTTPPSRPCGSLPIQDCSIDSSQPEVP